MVERNKGDKAVIENANIRGAFLNSDKNGNPWIRFLIEDKDNPKGDSIEAKAWGDTVNELMNRDGINEAGDYKGQRITFKGEWSDFGKGGWTIKSLPSQQPSQAQPESTDSTPDETIISDRDKRIIEATENKGHNIDFGMSLNGAIQIFCFKGSTMTDATARAKYFANVETVEKELKKYVVPIFNVTKEVRPVLIEALKNKIAKEAEEAEETEAQVKTETEEVKTERQTLPDGTEVPW